MEASSLEKNLPDDNVGSDSTLGVCSPLSWCGIVSLARVIAVCIGGVATHPSRREPGPSLSVVLCLVTIGRIVCMIPVSGLIFGVPVGAAHNFVALWTGCTLSVMIGRYFFREPIRALRWRRICLPVHVEDLHKDGFMALGLSTSTFLFDNRDRYHGVVLTMEVPQIQLSTARWTFLFGNRDRYHGFSRQWILVIDSVEDTPVWQQRQFTPRICREPPVNIVLGSTEVWAVPAEVTLRLLRLFTL